MPFTSRVTVNRITKRGENFQCATGMAGGAARVDQMFVVGGPFVLLPGEVYELTAEAPPETVVDTYGHAWQKWTKVVGLRRLRTSGAFTRKAMMRLSGVGRLRSKILWDAYGPDALRILLDPNRIDEVAEVLGGGRTGTYAATVIHCSAAAIESGDRLRQEEFDFYVWLEENGVTNGRVAAAAWQLLKGTNVLDRLRKHPYILAGLTSWEVADHVGRGLLRNFGIDDKDIPEHRERLLGGIDSIARSALADGNSALSLKTVQEGLSSRKIPRPSGSPESLAPLGGQLVWTGEAFQLRAAAWIEQGVAGQIRNIRASVSRWTPPSDLVACIRQAECRARCALTEEQRLAVKNLLQSQFSILLGGAGTGKTFLLRILVDVFVGNGGRILMAALAGKAALNLGLATGKPARTIANTIELLRRRRRLEQEGRTLPAEMPELDARSLLIIDEASMIDTPTFYELFEMVPEGCRVLLVGDHGQLPPIGWGQVFHDLAIRDFDVTRLSQVQRQRKGSGVMLLASSIREGICPPREITETFPGVVFVEAPENMVVDAVQKVTDQIDYIGGSDLLICAARRQTVDSINNRFALLRHTENNATEINPHCSVAVGDPVICCRNHYGNEETGELRNGMLGTVAHVLEEGCHDHAAIRVLWQGEEVPRLVTGSVLLDIDLAFAITAHRAQGSGAQNVIVVLEGGRMVTRQWLYTAVTRAKDRVWLIGQWRAFCDALSRSVTRMTGFPRALGGL